MNAQRSQPRVLALALALTAVCGAGPSPKAHKQTAERDSVVYVDERRNVHVVTTAHKDVRITKDGRYGDPKLSPDGRSIGVLVISTVRQGDDQASEPIEVEQELWIYRGRRVVRRLDPQGFIRAWSFANKGKAVAIYAGGLHFAGFYVLFDLDTGAELGRAADPVTDRSPAWVQGISQ